jgi:hypothetical protein
MLYRVTKPYTGRTRTLVPGMVVDTKNPKTSYELPMSYIDWEKNKYHDDVWFSLQREHRYLPDGILVPLSPSEITDYESRVEKFKREHWRQVGSYRASHTLGTDPEIFAQNANGVCIPAWKFLKPKELADTIELNSYTQKYIPFYPDGFAAEFQTATWSCVAFGVDRHQKMLKAIHTHLNTYDPQARLVADPVVDIPQQVLDEAPAEHVQLGCSPSLNAYALSGRSIDNGRELPIRVSGYHLHVSLSETEKRRIGEIIRAMDVLGGVTSVLALQGLESRQRRQYYGLPGEHRIKEYGVEYRALSGAVLWHPCITHFLTQFTRAGVQLVTSGMFPHLVKVREDEVIRCMLDLDVDIAKKIVNENREVWEKLIHHWYRDLDQPLNDQNYAPKGVQPPNVIVDEILFKGFLPYIELDVAKNWMLRPQDEGKWISHSEAEERNFWRFVVSRLGEYEGRD